MTSPSLPIITESLNLTPEVPTAHVVLSHRYSNPGKLSPELSTQSSWETHGCRLNFQFFRWIDITHLVEIRFSNEL